MSFSCEIYANFFSLLPALQMYVMQSLPHEAQGLASGIMNTLIRLASTLSMGIATAVYATYEVRASNETEPMLKFTRTFQVSVALSALSVLFVPFIRIGTQGHHDQQQKTSPIAAAAAAEAATADGEGDGAGLVEMQEGPGKEKSAGIEEKHDKLGGIDDQFWKKEFGG